MVAGEFRGVVTAVYAAACGSGLEDTVTHSLWLHLGTAPAGLLALRREVAAAVRGVWAAP